MSDTDLNELVARTEEQLEVSNARTINLKPARRVRLFIPELLLTAVTVTSVYMSWSALRGGESPGSAKLQAGMVGILHQARDSVQAVVAATGEPPSAIPNSSLAGIVGYHTDGSYYRIELKLGGNTGTLDSDGKLLINGVAPSAGN